MEDARSETGHTPVDWVILIERHRIVNTVEAMGSSSTDIFAIQNQFLEHCAAEQWLTNELVGNEPPQLSQFQQGAVSDV